MHSAVSVRHLLALGMHYGHRTGRCHPNMRRFLSKSRGAIHIIDVRHSLLGLLKAAHFLRKLAARDEVILFVGTKRQAGPVIKTEASRCGMPFVDQRWIGGTLTNYETIKSGLGRLKEIESQEDNGTIAQYSRSRRASLERERRKLDRHFRGLRQMHQLPAAVVLVDPNREAIALAEADKIGSATIALIDTDGDPEKVDIPIPGNDDSMKVILTVMSQLADAVIQGKEDVRPPETNLGDSTSYRNPPDDDGPAAAAAPARLRPKPTPGKTSKRRNLRGR